jgi:ParB-like chromosome segregation protein Spo0J
MAGPRTINVGFETVPVGRLRESGRNPNRNDVAAIAESIRANGFYGYVVANRRNGEVLIGNHRLMAAREVGLDEVPVVWIDADEKTSAWLLARDNELARRAWKDERALYQLLSELGSLEGTGYDQADWDDLIVYLRRAEPSLFETGRQAEREAAGAAEEAVDELADRYRRQSLYYVNLIYEPDEYLEVVRRLDALRERRGADSYAEALYRECEEICRSSGELSDD